MDFSSFVITLDVELARVGLARLSRRLDTVGARILPKVAKRMAATVDKGFLQGGIPDGWQPLAERTVAKRRRDRARGKPLVAGDEDQLRVTDNLRAAATDVSGVLKGSAYRINTGRDVVQIGVDQREIPYAATQQEGSLVRNIPARAFLVITDETREESEETAQKEINLLAVEWDKGKLF